MVRFGHPVAPSGFRRILDRVDPFPFLNQVCRG